MTPAEPAVVAPRPNRSPGVVFHGGNFVPPDRAVLPMSSIVLRYGVSVFEGVRMYRGHTEPRLVAWHFPAHLARLHESMALMQLPDPGVDDVTALLDELVERNGLTQDCYARISVSAGNCGLLDDDVESVLTVSVTPMGRKKWLAGESGLRLQVSEWTRPDASTFPAAAKCISAYAGPRVAALRARAAGYDGCLLRTADGLISEAPTASVLVVRDGLLATPRLQDCILPGITRAWALAVTAAGSIPGLSTVPGGGPAPISPADLAQADEVLLCGTGLEFARVASVDGKPCAAWPATPRSLKLIQRLFDEARGVLPATDVDWRSR